MRTITKTDKAYAAGILDGEGNTGIYKMVRNTKYSNHPIYRLIVGISNTNKEVIQWLTETFDCCHPTLRYPKTVDGNKPIYMVRFQDLNAIAFLDIVKDYVIIKRLQVALALGFGEFQSEHNYKGNNKVPEWVMCRREGFYQSSRFFNQVGVNHESD